jgi:methylenetetrahydrofolate reductase (NADPH)
MTNMDEGAANTVTWGVFPGKEIVQPTIIEEVSFRAWKDEAFAIWDEWAKLYPINSYTAKLLRNIKDNYWLTSIVHHDYHNPNALWDILGV